MDGVKKKARWITWSILILGLSLAWTNLHANIPDSAESPQDVSNAALSVVGKMPKAQMSLDGENDLGIEPPPAYDSRFMVRARTADSGAFSYDGPWVRYYPQGFEWTQILAGDISEPPLATSRYYYMNEKFAMFHVPSNGIRWPPVRLNGVTLFGNKTLHGKLFQGNVFYRLTNGRLVAVGGVLYVNGIFFPDGSYLIERDFSQTPMLAKDPSCEPAMHYIEYRDVHGKLLWARSILASIDNSRVIQEIGKSCVGGRLKIHPIKDNMVEDFIDLGDGTVFVISNTAIVRLRLSTGYPDEGTPKVFIVDGLKVRALKKRIAAQPMMQRTDQDYVTGAIRTAFMFKQSD